MYRRTLKRSKNCPLKGAFYYIEKCFYVIKSTDDAHRRMKGDYRDESKYERWRSEGFDIRR